MAEEKSIAERVRVVVAEITGRPIEQITDNATFEDLQADSLDIIETIIGIELEWDGKVVIDDEAFTMASTIADLIAEVEGKVNGQG